MTSQELAIAHAMAVAWNAAVQTAAKIVEEANDETSRQCIVEAIRKLDRSIPAIND